MFSLWKQTRKRFYSQFYQKNEHLFSKISKKKEKLCLVFPASNRKLFFFCFNQKTACFSFYLPTIFFFLLRLEKMFPFLVPKLKCFFLSWQHLPSTISVLTTLPTLDTTCLLLHHQWRHHITSQDNTTQHKAPLPPPVTSPHNLTTQHKTPFPPPMSSPHYLHVTSQYKTPQPDRPFSSCTPGLLPL